MRPKINAAAMSIKMIPMIAAVPYAAFTPRPAETMRPNHKITLSMTADPRPAVARAKPASGPATPERVSMRYPRAVLAALPPGNTLPTALVLN